jgi:hypothetical protein
MVKNYIIKIENVQDRYFTDCIKWLSQLKTDLFKKYFT